MSGQSLMPAYESLKKEIPLNQKCPSRRLFILKNRIRSAATPLTAAPQGGRDFFG
jgi:hypothetical protein